MFKKIFVAAAVVMGFAAISANAQEALYSDIDTYINNYPISGYAVDGKMTVIAEDLRDYGFNVDWDAEARALHITRNPEIKELKRKDIYDPKYPSGTKYSDIYPSDIKVDYNGTLLTSYALDGVTMIPVNDLALLAGSEEWDGESRTYKVWLENLSQCEYKPLKKRCINLWYGTGNRPMPDLIYSDDMDSDGEDERIELKITGTTVNDGITASLKIGQAYINNIIPSTTTWSIDAVYFADLTPNDNAKELAIYTLSDSDDPELYIYRYSQGKIEPLTFKIWESWDNKYSYRSSWYTGYIETYVFDVNDDGSFTIQEQTDSFGMWDVYVPYKLNESNVIERVQKDSYPVVANTSYGYNEWGFWYVDKTLTGYGLPLYSGDWIKPIADNMNGNILIEKNDGTTGWVIRNWDNFSLFEGCSRLFWMAG